MFFFFGPGRIVSDSDVSRRLWADRGHGQCRAEAAAVRQGRDDVYPCGDWEMFGDREYGIIEGTVLTCFEM